MLRGRLSQVACQCGVGTRPSLTVIATNSSADRFGRDLVSVGSPNMSSTAQRDNRRGGRLFAGARLHYRTGVAIVAMLLVVVGVTLPFSLGSIWDELTGPPEGDVFRIGP